MFRAAELFLLLLIGAIVAFFGYRGLQSVDKKVFVLERRVDAHRDFNAATSAKVTQQDVALQGVRARVENVEGALRGADGNLINVASAIAEMKKEQRERPSSSVPANPGVRPTLRSQGPVFELREWLPFGSRQEQMPQALAQAPERGRRQPPPVQKGDETIERIAELERRVGGVENLASGALQKYEVESMPNSGDGWSRMRVYAQKRGLWYLWVWSPRSAPILRVFNPQATCINGQWGGAWVLLDLSKYPLPTDFPRPDLQEQAPVYEPVPVPDPTLLPEPEPINPSGYQTGRVAQK
ncbi:MAG: hypothetical protein ABIP54_03100 [Candidatus Andersenbacteria bacterium]